MTSPTFTIGQRYEGAVPVSHLDLHRLACDHRLAGEDPALLDDYLTADAIAFVEWPEPAADAIAEPAVRGRARPRRRRRPARSRS